MHLTCFLFFKNRRVCAYIIGSLVTEDKLSLELVIVTCGNVVDRLLIAVSIISLHKTLAKPVIVSNRLFFDLKHVHESVTVIPINVVYKRKYGLGVTHFFSSLTCTGVLDCEDQLYLTPENTERSLQALQRDAHKHFQICLETALHRAHLVLKTQPLVSTKVRTYFLLYLYPIQTKHTPSTSVSIVIHVPPGKCFIVSSR